MGVDSPLGGSEGSTNDDSSDPQDMQTSDEAVDFIIYWEGPYNEQPYEDLGGYCTIGYGHVLLHDECTGAIKKYYRDNPLSPSGAEDFLQADLANSEKYVRDSITVELTQAQFDALVSYVFNSGGEPNQPFHTKGIPELINSGNYQEAAKAIASGPISSNGLTSDKLKERRQAEAYLFLNSIYLVP